MWQLSITASCCLFISNMLKPCQCWSQCMSMWKPCMEAQPSACVRCCWEIYISSNQLGKAAQVLQYLQSCVAPRTSDRAVTAHHDDVSKGPSAPHVQEQQQQQQHLSGPRSPAGSPRFEQTNAAVGHIQQTQQQQHDGQQHHDLLLREHQQHQHQATVPQWGNEEQWCCCSTSDINLPIVSRCSSQFMRQV